MPMSILGTHPRLPSFDAHSGQVKAFSNLLITKTVPYYDDRILGPKTLF